jgi:hypothetical protein
MNVKHGRGDVNRPVRNDGRPGSPRPAVIERQAGVTLSCTHVSPRHAEGRGASEHLGSEFFVEYNGRLEERYGACSASTRYGPVSSRFFRAVLTAFGIASFRRQGDQLCSCDIGSSASTAQRISSRLSRPSWYANSFNRRSGLRVATGSSSHLPVRGHLGSWIAAGVTRSRTQTVESISSQPIQGRPTMQTISSFTSAYLPRS